MANALVLGSSGFIGSHLCQHLIDSGWAVIGIDKQLPHINLSREVFRAELHQSVISIDSLNRIKPNPDAIFITSGPATVANSAQDPVSSFEDSIHSLALTLEYARFLTPRPKLVFVSSAAVYGDQRQSFIKETTPLRPVSLYGEHKLVAEELCKTYSRVFGLEIAIVRLFSVYGEGLRKQLIWDACTKLNCEDFQFYGTGNELRDWIHVSDAITLLSCSLGSANNQCPIFNGGCALARTNREVLTTLATAFGLKTPILFNKIISPMNPAVLVADNSRALTLGWAPQVDFNIGIQSYVKWFKSTLESRAA